REKEVRLALRVRVREEQWVVGSPVVLFPPGVRRQYARVWNDSDHERPFLTEAPAGYRVLCQDLAVDEKPLPVAASAGIDLCLQRIAGSPEDAADAEWRAGPEGEPVRLMR